MPRGHAALAGDEEPLFNIGAVSRMTGISETTLRVWERRYHFPLSARTAGGHRLYSQEQVQRLQWVKQRVDAGMQISQAIRALEHLEREGASSDTALTTRAATIHIENGDVANRLRAQLFKALVEHDSAHANETLVEALAIFSPDQVVLEIIRPTLHDIGEAWSAQQLDVATEHFASNLLRQQLLMWLRSAPPAYEVAPVLLACAPGELHEGSLLMLAVLLRRLRWPVIYLGQTVPLFRLERFVEEVDAAIIVFVAMTEDPARALADWPRLMPEIARRRHPAVCFGGRAFNEQPELTEAIPGLFLGATIQDGVEKLDLMQRELNRPAR